MEEWKSYSLVRPHKPQNIAFSLDFKVQSSPTVLNHAPLMVQQVALSLNPDAMKPENFASDCTGNLVPTIEGMKAFVPHKLPPKLDLNGLLTEFGEASAALGGLKEIGSTLHNPYMVIRPLQRHEALKSSAMEGTFSTADNLAIVEALDGFTSNDAAREVHNYIRAIDFAVDAMKSIPISHRLIRGMHAVLLERASKERGANKTPGDYKTQQNWIGAMKIKEARFIPPPPDAASKCMDDLEGFINSPHKQLPPLISAGLTHYQFETIHPFGDGNGRVGRMIITLQLVADGMLTAPLLYLSPYIETNKDEYIDAMFAVSSSGDWNRWLKYFLRAVKVSCDETVKTINLLNDLEKEYRQKIQTETKSVSAIAISDFLFERPVISITEAAQRSGTSYQAAKKNIERMVDLKILEQVAGFENPKLYWSKKIIDISDGYH